MKFSPQKQGNQLTPYATMRDTFIHQIQKSYVQGGQYVTNSLKETTEIDLDAEDPQQNLSNKTGDKIWAIE